MIVHVIKGAPDHSAMISGCAMRCNHGPQTGTAQTRLGSTHVSVPRTFLSWEHAAAVILGWPLKHEPPSKERHR